MNLFLQIKKILNYSGANRDEYEKIISEICEHNRKRMLVFSLISAFFLAVMSVIAYLGSSFGFEYSIYLIPLLIVALIYLVTYFFTENRPVLLNFIIYAFMSILYLTAIYISTYASKAQTAGTFLAFLLAVPMLFVIRPWENICMIGFFVALFIITVVRVKSPDVILIDVIDALIFGCIGMVVSTFILMTTVENFAMKNKMAELAERDQLTKLFNRTSYEHSVPRYPGYCKKSLACIYADVNGLHELNETSGHHEGDRMLQFVSAALCEQFGKNHTYRIGGDEFVAFAIDFEEDVLKEKLKKFIGKIEEAGYYASVGYDIQKAENISMKELIKAAEQKMYCKKNEFYRNKIDSRQKRR